MFFILLVWIRYAWFGVIVVLHSCKLILCYRKYAHFPCIMMVRYQATICHIILFAILDTIIFFVLHLVDIANICIILFVVCWKCTEVLNNFFFTFLYRRMYICILPTGYCFFNNKFENNYIIMLCNHKWFTKNYTIK